MKHVPTYLLQKVQQSLDPYAEVRQPAGSLYKTARWFRDMPLDHPWISGTAILPIALMGALVPGGSAIAAVGAAAWTGSAIYSTGKELAAAMPSMAKHLEQIGRGRHEFSSPMVDTNAARSMRQASLRAIHDSGYMLRSVIGAEARLMHR